MPEKVGFSITRVKSDQVFFQLSVKNHHNCQLSVKILAICQLPHPDLLMCTVMKISTCLLVSVPPGHSMKLSRTMIVAQP